MKTTISKILLAGTFLISFTACNFLDEESETRYTAQYVFETEEGLELATNALYTLDRNYQNDKAGEAAATLALRRATDLSVTKGGTGNFYGTYEGTLPAADCEGIKTTLTLNKDKTYILRSEYIGEGEKSATYESKGHYNLINGNLIELSLTSSNEKSYYKILDGSKLMLSDKEGSINQGILSEHYILKKK